MQATAGCWEAWEAWEAWVDDDKEEWDVYGRPPCRSLQNHTIDFRGPEKRNPESRVRFPVSANMQRDWVDKLGKVRGGVVW